MTVLIIAQLICDRCEKVYDASPEAIDSKAAIRVAAAGEGWLIRSGGKLRDLCPTCKPAADPDRAAGRAEEHADEIIRRYRDEREPARVIAAALLLSYSGVYAVLDRAGVPRRPRGWPKGKRRGPRSAGGVRARL